MTTGLGSPIPHSRIPEEAGIWGIGIHSAPPQGNGSRRNARDGRETVNWVGFLGNPSILESQARSTKLSIKPAKFSIVVLVVYGTVYESITNTKVEQGNFCIRTLHCTKFRI